MWSKDSKDRNKFLKTEKDFLKKWNKEKFNKFDYIQIKDLCWLNDPL